MHEDTKNAVGSSIAEIVADKHLEAVFQPVVHLESGDIVGYEALARGPVGTPFEMPAGLFAAARAAGVNDALDRACREVALSAALAGGLDHRDLLFLNVEPSTLGMGGALDRHGEERLREVSVVVELTERMLTTRPAEVLSAVGWLRERGCRIALDDVGIDPRSLALMPFVSPDVIKLDMRITQDRLDSLVAARALNAIGAEVERSGALLVAEGIETSADLDRARSLGATLGQGFLLGRPGPLDPPRREGSRIEIPRTEPERPTRSTPFARLSAKKPPREGGFGLVLSLSRQLEDEVEALREEAILVSNFQRSEDLTDGTLARYERLSRTAALVAALGPGMAQRPGQGIRGADIPPDDDLYLEWDVTVVGPHFAAAFAARELMPERPDQERRFEYIVSYDREVAIDAASLLLRCVVRSN